MAVKGSTPPEVSLAGSPTLPADSASGAIEISIVRT